MPGISVVLGRVITKKNLGVKRGLWANAKGYNGIEGPIYKIV